MPAEQHTETLAAFGQYNFTIGAARVITDRLPDQRYRDYTDIQEVRGWSTR